MSLSGSRRHQGGEEGIVDRLASAPAGKESPAALRRRVAAVANALQREYGRPRSHRGKPLDVLVGTILSQNTSDVNSGLAFSRLRERLPTWDQVADADVRTIEAAIRPGGLSKIKAPRIRRILRGIRRERGRLALDFLADMTDDEALSYLLALPGVGLKTASVVLLFALDRRVFPVDTHVLRVSRRLQLIGPKTSADRAHAELAALIPPRRRHALHLNMITHGRRICRAGRPDCRHCLLDGAALCPYPRRHGYT